LLDSVSLRKKPPHCGGFAFYAFRKKSERRSILEQADFQVRCAVDQTTVNQHFAIRQAHNQATVNDAFEVNTAGLGAFFNTNGSIAAFLVAMFNLGVATLLYMPFVAIANKAQTTIDEEESEEEIALALKF
jgi:hypothetical protein